MTVIIPPDLDLANFVPKRRNISNVTVAENAIVTTTEPHGYITGQFVRLHVVLPNPMVLDTVKAQITIDATDPNNDVNFVTNVDTSLQVPFMAPAFPPGFTAAHCVPITGLTRNIAGPLI